MAEPRELLTHPADGFVADFLGRDRGYRSLGFEHHEVPVHDERTVRLGETVGDSDDWVLAVDDDGRPQGWVRPGRVDGPVTEDDLALGGTLARVDGSLRAALDAALSSPSRRGVVIDADGRLVGTALAPEVVTVIERVERPEAPEDPTSSPEGGGERAVDPRPPR